MKKGPVLKIGTAKRVVREKKFRDSRGWFVAEGDRWMDELVKAQAQVIGVFATKEWVDTSPLAKAVGMRYAYALISESEMAQLSDTHSPAGVLAVVEKPRHKLPKDMEMMLVLDGLRDPGNVGTLVRSGAASGVDAIVCLPSTVDIYNPKVVRSTMGALYKVPIVHQSLDEVAVTVKGTKVYLADSNGALGYTDAEWKHKSALVIGNEAHGVRKEMRELATEILSIPMHNNVESLNAGVAGSVILFEAMRQRNEK